MRPPALLIAATFLAAPALTGCYGDVESYVPASAKQHCKRLRECDRGTFDDRYGGDLRECRDEVEQDLFDAADLLEDIGWEYDPDAGKACIEVQRDLRNDCSTDADADIAAVCDDVLWDGF